MLNCEPLAQFFLSLQLYLIVRPLSVLICPVQSVPARKNEVF